MDIDQDTQIIQGDKQSPSRVPSSLHILARIIARYHSNVLKENQKGSIHSDTAKQNNHDNPHGDIPPYPGPCSLCGGEEYWLSSIGEYQCCRCQPQLGEDNE